ncbi:MAG: hypothetical protein IAF58_00820 [Leptolyngbya sp.]|nr:hypothetical protein [Candidatus Melainabacteria bacterium]
MRKDRQTIRNARGSMLIIIILTVAFVVVPLVIFVSQTGFYSIDQGRIKSTVEAASLLAANDLSRVFIDDSTFGYVSLSNFPPNGKATCAPDGEPLPVTGINTLVGTIRQNAIVAHELVNPTLERLVEEDRESSESTVDDLNAALRQAVQKETPDTMTDIYGRRIEPLKDVTEFLKANLPPGLEIESVEIENGWLAAPTRTTIPIPDLLALANLKKGTFTNGFYSSFVDVPAHGKPFTFAGLGTASALVKTADFRSERADKINSIVKVECTVVCTNPSRRNMPMGLEAPQRIRVAACSQPFTMPDNGPAGLMTIRFSGGSVAGLQSWQDFLKPENFHDHQVNTYEARGGDYPIDPTARMKLTDSDVTNGTSAQFAQHLYYWLRNGHLRPKLSSILGMLSLPFQSGPNDIYAYEFNNNGKINRRVIAKDPFFRGMTSDAQESVTVDTSTNHNTNPIIIFRDNVKKLGIQSGGKHAGQPLAGYPLNWCEIADYGGDENIASRVLKGRLGTGLTLLDPTGGANSLFRGSDGKTMCLQPRRSYYSGGLALDIEIGGTKLPEPQKLDVATVSAIKRGRGI